MKRTHFGTDGVRGVANEAVSPELAFRIGQASGRYLATTKQSMRAVVCRDTRRSGTMLEMALAAGLNSVGVSVDLQGVAPTPSVTFAARVFDYGLGVVVSASHNPANDNGIKLIGHEGRKLSDEAEFEIERLMDEPLAVRSVGADVGVTNRDDSTVEAYLQFLERLVPERLDGMKIAVDAAHGAAYRYAPEILVRLGAEVKLIGASPDGMNINAEGGATKPECVQQLTVQEGCDVGVAFDGDADRAVFSDEQGRLINGDRTMAYWALHWKSQGRLNPPTVVGTVMSNMGFEAELRSNGIELVRAPVGDKYVSQRIGETNAQIGGEQSGHIIFPSNGPTGDGLATMIEFLRVVRLRGEPSSAAFDLYEPWPQLLINVAVASKDGWESNLRIVEAIRSAEESMVDCGRLNVRASGTQPMIRIMSESSDESLRDKAADLVFHCLETELGGHIYSRVDLTHALGD